MKMNNPTDQAVYAMMHQMEEDKKAVVHICKREILELLQLGSRICNMTYTSKLTQTRMMCFEQKHMRVSWLEDSGDINIKRINWMYHQLPWFTYTKTQHWEEKTTKILWWRRS